MARNPNSYSEIDQLSNEQAQDALPQKADWKRSDRPDYGVLGEHGHKAVYEGWRSNSRIPNLPGWEEMDDSARAIWSTSSQGAPLIRAAKKQLVESNPTVGGKLVVSSPEAKDKTSAVRQARYKQNIKIASAAFPTPAHQAVFEGRGELLEEKQDENGNWSTQRETNVRNAQHPEIPQAFSTDFSKHDKMSALVDRIVSSHSNATGERLPENHPISQIARTAKEELSVSAKAQSLGMKPLALQKFLSAHQQINLLAQKVHGAAINRGDGVGFMSSHLAEANQHVSDYEKIAGDKAMKSVGYSSLPPIGKFR